LTESSDRPSYTFQVQDDDSQRVYYRGRDGKRYCLYDDGQHGFPRVRFSRCTEEGEPILVLSMPFPDDFDRYVSPAKGGH
jgi:hypothetical protein